MPSKRKSAFSAALQEAQQQSAPPQNSDTVEKLHGDTVSESNRETVSTSSSPSVSQLDSATVVQKQRETVEPSHSDTVQEGQRIEFPPSHGETVKPSKDQFSRKVSFYLTPGQEKKLDDLADDYRRLHEGKRINRNDIVRHLVDQCTLESLESLE